MTISNGRRMDSRMKLDDRRTVHLVRAEKRGVVETLRDLARTAPLDARRLDMFQRELEEIRNELAMHPG